MARTIKRGENPVKNYMPASHFSPRSEAFDNMIDKMGYNIKLYKAAMCPCQLSDENSAQASCRNCRGLGYIFYNPVETKAIITSLNYRSKTHEWTIENMGTASITTYENNNMSNMDKVQILDTYSRFSQLVTVKRVDSLLYSYTTYKPSLICEAFAFSGVDSALLQIPKTDYKLTEFGVEWLNPSLEGMRVSLRYKHLLEYLIIDLPHNMRQSTYKEHSGEIVQEDFPIMGVGRVAHFALAMPDWDGSDLLNNDTEAS